MILMVLFSLSFACAYMSKHIHRTAVPLSRLQWKFKGIRYLLLKLKLMTYFERLSSTRKIGVTLGPTITLTMPIFSQVIKKKYNKEILFQFQRLKNLTIILVIELYLIILKRLNILHYIHEILI